MSRAGPPLVGPPQRRVRRQPPGNPPSALVTVRHLDRSRTLGKGDRGATGRAMECRRLTVRAPAADSTFPNSAKAAFNSTSLARAVPAADIWRRHRRVNEAKGEWDAADHRRR